MRALLLALVLALPVAAGASFFTLPAPGAPAASCGDDTCIALLPGDESVLVHEGQRYAFLGPAGAPLATGSLCDDRLLQVPPGATLLVVSPGPCER